MKLGTRRLIVGSGVTGVVLVAGFLIWFFGQDAPDEVTIDRAVGATEAATDGDGVSAEVDAQGTWVVRTDVRPYSFAESTGTFVGFRIDEELSGIGANTAVGRTSVVTGTLTFDGETLSAADVTADLSQLETDDSRRDRRTLEALGVAVTPDAIFVLTVPIDLGREPAVGQTLSVTAVGELTVSGTARAVTVPLEAALLNDGVLVVTGSFSVELADFGVTAPSAPLVLSVSDRATVELQLYLTKA